MQADNIDLNAADNDGEAPLQIALVSLRTTMTPEHRNIVDALVSAGALVYKAPAHVSALYSWPSTSKTFMTSLSC